MEAALRRPTARAAAGITSGPLEGFIDSITPHQITGWARDKTHPHLPVTLGLWVSETLLATLLACNPRDDLATNSAFTYTPARPFTAWEQSHLHLCRLADGAALHATIVQAA